MRSPINLASSVYAKIRCCGSSTSARVSPVVPGVELAVPVQLQADLDLANQAAGHFWFLETNPHAWDVYTARNQVAFKHRRDGRNEEVPVPAPGDVPFSRDPFRRLVRMHATTTEMMTGYEYFSPWPRPDAWRR
jgi:hypothetical protein